MGGVPLNSVAAFLELEVLSNNADKNKQSQGVQQATANTRQTRTSRIKVCNRQRRILDKRFASTRENCRIE